MLQSKQVDGIALLNFEGDADNVLSSPSRCKARNVRTSAETPSCETAVFVLENCQPVNMLKDYSLSLNVSVRFLDPESSQQRPPDYPLGGGR